MTIPRNRALTTTPRKPNTARRLLGDALSMLGMLGAGIGLLAVVTSTCAPPPAASKEPARYTTHCEDLGDTGATICRTEIPFPSLVVCYSIVGGMDVPALDCR